VATKTRRANDQKARRAGKEQSGWDKLGVYLSPEASTRLMLASLKRGKDRSTILDSLIKSNLPAYVISVGSNDRQDVTADVNLAGAVPA
jgi:hypothetical protein